MTLDIVIGNPPYQEMVNGGSITKSSIPIYAKFIQRAAQLSPRYISMIIPSRWMSGGSAILDSFRTYMVDCHNLINITNYPKSTDIFSTVKIAGGVQYFLIDTQAQTETVSITNISSTGITKSERRINEYTYRDSSLSTQYLILSDNIAVEIVHKALSKDEVTLSNLVLPYAAFGIPTNFVGDETPQTETSITVTSSNNRISYIDSQNITLNTQKISDWKVITGQAASYTINSSGKTRVLTTPRILAPNEVCTSTYLIINTFKTKEEAEQLIEVLKTKFVRFLIYIAMAGMHITSRTFLFVPNQAYNPSIQYTDEYFYKKYNISPSEQAYIASKIV